MTLTRRDFARASVVGAVSGKLRATAAGRPNVILFYVDELRATALRLYHSDGLETENLSRLARRGVTFTHAFTPHPLCMPARASLWTGQYSDTHGSRCNQMPLGEDRVCMADLLHKAGYRLGVFGKNHCFTPEQLSRWFAADYSLNSPLWNRALTPAVTAQVRAHSRWIQERGGAMMPPSTAPFPPEIFNTRLITERAMEFIEHSGADPFAVWISIPDPHHPIQTPEPFAHVAPPDRIKLPAFNLGEMKSKNTRMQIYDYLIRGEELPESFLRQFLSIYYGMIAFIDHELGRLMALLERTGKLENTIILFTSDHGDFAAEHHLVIKTGSLLDSMVRVPMLLSWPARVTANRREEALVSQVDIMPTLLEWCDIAVPRGVEGRRLPLRPDDARRSHVYSEYGAGDPQFTWQDARSLGPAKRLGDYALKTPAETQALAKREREGHLQMIRTRTHKLIRDSNGEVEFYDLIKDPGELRNVHGRVEYTGAEKALDGQLRSHA